MLWGQADWLSVPTALASFASTQEWEASSLSRAYASLGIHWVDVATVLLAQDTLSLYVLAPQAPSTSMWHTGSTFLRSFLLDLAWSVNLIAPNIQLPLIHGVGSKLTKFADAAPLHLAQTQLWLEFWVCSSAPAEVYAAVTASLPTWLLVVQGADPFLLAVETFFVATVCFTLDRWIGANAKQAFYDDLITLLKYNNISLTEVAVTLTLVVGFAFFDIFISFAEEDVVDTLNYLILLFLLLTFAFLLAGVDLQYFFMVSNAGGDLTLRIVCFDLINNLLCALRVFFCWVRYIFYDLQVELVDMTFQYTDSVNEVTLTAWFDLHASNLITGGQNPGSLWAAFSALAWVLLATFLDVACYILQALTGLFKLVIASFLLWLIVDLFLLRGFALDESHGLVKAKNRRR